MNIIKIFEDIEPGTSVELEHDYVFGIRIIDVVGSVKTVYNNAGVISFFMDGVFIEIKEQDSPVEFMAWCVKNCSDMWVYLKDYPQELYNYMALIYVYERRRLPGFITLEAFVVMIEKSYNECL